MNVKKALIEMLGTESESTWIEFMAFLNDKMPFLSSKGRPTKIEINTSIIGEHGFSSFKDMCNAPVDENGLGWNYNTYRLWKKSWSVLKNHPYLNELNLTPSEINTIVLDCVKNEIEFPVNEDELNNYKRSSKSAAKEALTKANSANIKELLDAKAQITLLKSQIEDNATLKLQNATLSEKNNSLEQMLSQNKQSSEKLENALKDQIEVLNNSTKKLSLKFQEKDRLAKKRARELSGYKKMGFFKRIFNYTVTI